MFMGLPRDGRLPARVHAPRGWPVLHEYPGISARATDSNISLCHTLDRRSPEVSYLAPIEHAKRRP